MFNEQKKEDIYSLIEHQVKDFSPKIMYWFNDYINRNNLNTNGKRPEILIGTDSTSGRGKTVFSVAVVINTKGRGGEYIYKKFNISRNLSIFEKIYSEAHTSLLVAQMLQDMGICENFSDIIVHIDANTDTSARSFQYFQSIVGMVKGSGFDVVGKPYAYAATNVADRHCRS